MKTMSLKLPRHLGVKLDRAAKTLGQSKSEVVRRALEQFLNGDQAGLRPMSALDLAGDAVGRCPGPSDLSTNPKYLQGYGS